LQQRKWNRL